MNTLLAVAKHAAQSAGLAIMDLYDSSAFELKSNNTPVTLADTTAHEIIMTELKETNISILSEESEGVTLPYPERMWIIDPMDGTKGFIHKDGDFSVMIGLLSDGYPTLGVVYLPVEQSFYFAISGEGAFYEKDGVVTKISVHPTNAPLRFLRSRHNTSPFIDSVTLDLQAENIPKGSIGIKAGCIGQNEGDFFFTDGRLGEWDICAPSIIMEEAGGKVTDLHGAKVFYGTKNHLIEHGVVFSNGACHDRVLNAIQKHR